MEQILDLFLSPKHLNSSLNWFRHLNFYMKDSIIVKDDFCPDIDLVRNSALQSGFGTWAPSKGEVGSSIYEGMNFWGDHASLLKGLYAALGRPVFPNSMFFRATKPGTEKAYVHSDRDAGSWTAIVYCSDHKEVSRTGFYQHQETGLKDMPSFDELRANPEFFDQLKKEMVDGDDSVWEQIDFVRGVYNRALIFRAPLFHARCPKDGFGSGTDETARIVWVCHFEL